MKYESHLYQLTLSVLQDVIRNTALTLFISGFRSIALNIWGTVSNPSDVNLKVSLKHVGSGRLNLIDRIFREVNAFRVWNKEKYVLKHFRTIKNLVWMLLRLFLLPTCQTTPLLAHTEFSSFFFQTDNGFSSFKLAFAHITAKKNTLKYLHFLCKVNMSS